MRWLLLFAAVVLGAVGLWVFFPGDQETKPTAVAAEPAPHESPPEVPVSVPRIAAPPAAETTPPGAFDAGATVDATFEVLTETGRLAGTRITLHNDAGVTLSGLADNFGLAHIEVTPGVWEATCSDDCKDSILQIGPSPATYTLDVHHWLTISGEVVDPAGRPIRAAKIVDERSECERLPDRDWQRLIYERSGPERRCWLADAVSDELGRFSFRTEADHLLVSAQRDDDHSQRVYVAPPQSGLRLTLFSYARVQFSFKGGSKYEAVALHSVVAGLPFDALIEQRRVLDLPVGKHEAIFVQRVNGKLWSAKAAFTVPAGGQGYVEVALSEAGGMQVSVVDPNQAPLPGVSVVAQYQSTESEAPAEHKRRVSSPDGGFTFLRALDPRDVLGVTDSNGTTELMPPGNTAVPLYQLTLNGPWTASPKLMRLGDEPVTIVATPR